MEQEKIKEIVDIDCVLDVHELIQNSERQHTKAVNEFNETLFAYTQQIDGKITIKSLNKYSKKFRKNSISTNAYLNATMAMKQQMEQK